MRSAFFASCFALTSLACLASAAGCATATSRDGFDDGVDAGPASADGDIDVTPDAGGGFGNQTDTDAAPVEGQREVYGHSADTLYKLDPDTHQITAVGKFDGCGASVVDLALDEGSNMFANSLIAVYRVEKTTGACTKLADGTDLPTSLSFVPKGTLDQDVEALVGYDNANYVRIDIATGTKSVIGTLGAGALVSSGDVVSVKGGDTFLTVKAPRSTDKQDYAACKKETECARCLQADCLVRVDPKTGKMLENWGPVGHKEVFGLAFWGGKVYGFDTSGKLFEIAFSGPKIIATDIPMSDKPAGLKFWGAGSATSAPLEPK